MLTVTGVREGTAEITVTATDVGGMMAVDTFLVDVNDPSSNMKSDGGEWRCPEPERLRTVRSIWR